MSKGNYAKRLFEQTEVLTAVVHHRFVYEGYDFTDASHLAQGYMQSFLVNLLAGQYSQKDTIAVINSRIFAEQQQIDKLKATV